MVNALVQLSENSNRVLNVIKATYDLDDKSAAIEFVVNRYIETEGSPELRPEFIKRMNRIVKEPTVRVDNLEKRYGLRKEHHKKSG